MKARPYVPERGTLTSRTRRCPSDWEAFIDALDGEP